MTYELAKAKESRKVVAPKQSFVTDPSAIENSYATTSIPPLIDIEAETEHGILWVSVNSITFSDKDRLLRIRSGTKIRCFQLSGKNHGKHLRKKIQR